MVQQCVVCGFAADTMVSLPDEWVAYLDSACGVDQGDQDMAMPMCFGCQQTVETLLDPRHPTGGEDPDTAVRTFLDDISQPKQ